MVLFQNIHDQILELAIYHYRINRPGILHINQKGINHLSQHILDMYPWEPIYDMMIGSFPEERIFYLEDCVNDRNRISDVMMEQMKEALEFENGTMSKEFSRTIISISPLCFEVYKSLTHNDIMGILDLYNYY